MTKEREIRARYDRDTIVIYQAYSPQIANAALKAQAFVAPFSFHRMTWIKPSFLWLMHRSNWGQKANQQKTLAVHITRSGWDKALSLGVHTHPEPSVYSSPSDWDAQFKNARVHIQWDTERSLRGTGLNHFSIQVGISRYLIQEFNDEWIVQIEDLSPMVEKIRNCLRSGKEQHAKRALPIERVYPVSAAMAQRLYVG